MHVYVRSLHHCDAEKFRTKRWTNRGIHTTILAKINVDSTTGCWQCQQQITLNNIEEGVRGDLLKRRSASGKCDAVLRKFTVHIIFARIVDRSGESHPLENVI